MSSRKIGEELENALLPLIQFKGGDQYQERPARILLWWLRRLSIVYGFVAQARLWLFEHGILQRYPLGCQVISVGNITAGGTGKTPMVEYLARVLQSRGRRVAILSRGYRRKEESLGKKVRRHGIVRRVPLVVSDGHQLRLDCEHSGDEPYMLASNLEGVVVLVDKDRVNSGRYAVRTFGCDTLILDDGFQYQRLRHRMDLVLVDRGNPFGNGNVLPRGILREPLRNLRRARFICITKVRGRDTDALRAQIRQLNPEAGLMECDHEPCLLRHAFTREPLSLEALRGARIFSVAGIASPASFDTSLEDLGATILGRHHFADHHRFSKEEVEELVQEAASLGASMLVTTEKDAVRMPSLDSLAVPIYFLRIEIHFISGQDEFERCVAFITHAHSEKNKKEANAS